MAGWVDEGDWKKTALFQSTNFHKNVSLYLSYLLPFQLGRRSFKFNIWREGDRIEILLKYYVDEQAKRHHLIVKQVHVI